MFGYGTSGRIIAEYTGKQASNLDDTLVSG